MAGWFLVRRSADLQPERTEEPTWWQDAVFYQVYLRSFADSDADGFGDLAGLRSRLGYLELVGVDAVRLTGQAPDVTAFDKLVADAREHSIRIILDLTDYAEPGADLGQAIRQWLDRGADGVQIDLGAPEQSGYRMARQIVDQTPGRMTFGPSGELHLAENDRLTAAEFDADLVRQAIEDSLTPGKPVSWRLSHANALRQVTRYGGAEAGPYRARAMALVLFALPGAVFLYNGEELGLPSVELPDWAWDNAGRAADRELDGSRIPMPWEGEAPPFGFTEARAGWLPMPNEWGPLTVEAQLEDAGSMLSLYRQAIELRHSHPGFAGDEIEWYGAPPGCFAFRRKGGGLVCALNTSGALVPLPDGEILASSAPLQDGQLPPDASVWLM
jgi:alpha-glucosidase